MLNKLILIIIIILSSYSLFSQNKGKLSVSVESTSQLYENDKETGAQKPDDKFASNNYVDFKYNYEKFTAGLRFELYAPSLMGHDIRYKESDIANKFINFTNDFLSVTAGNFYDQFGSGIIFRSYEERQLGIDNSIEGLHVKFKANPFINIKGFVGKHRKVFELSKGRLRGADVEILLSDMLNFKALGTISLGASTVNKYQEYTGPIDDYTTSLNAYSQRVSFDGNHANLSVEYATTENDNLIDNKIKKGKALNLNTGFFKNGLSINASFRRLENMLFRSEREEATNLLDINYLPSLTKQHKYSLNNIYVYSTQANGEIGYQIDLFYKFKKKTFLGGKYGTYVNINYSTYNDLKYKDNNEDTDFFAMGDNVLFKDFNVEISKKISKKLKTILVYNYSEYNKKLIEGGDYDIIKPHVVVADVLYKFSRKKYVRVELQHMWNKTDTKDWMSGLIELSFAPKFSFYAQDNYNYGADKAIHYYKFGTSYVKGTTRLDLSYGRTRAGISCVGGICRYLPAMKGFTFALTSKF